MTQIFTSPIPSKPNAFNTISSGASSSRTIGTITRPHNGVDFAVPTGTDLTSIGTGKVIYAQLQKPQICHKK
jgi:murein DD-endopeptidase MepM/ murein hydrolase activator NlpD